MPINSPSLVDIFRLFTSDSLKVLMDCWRKRAKRVRPAEGREEFDIGWGGPAELNRGKDVAQENENQSARASHANGPPVIFAEHFVREGDGICKPSVLGSSLSIYCFET